MRISEIKDDARSSLKGYAVLAGLFIFIQLLISAVPPNIADIVLSGGFSNWLDRTDTSISSSIFQFIYIIVLIPLNIASTWFFLNLIREEEPKISSIFTIYQKGKLVFKLIWTSIVQFILVLLWLLLLIVPGIIKGLSYSQTFFVLKDHPEYSAGKAIKESKLLMKGYKWKFFLLGLSFIGWALLTAAPIIIGIIAFALLLTFQMVVISIVFLVLGILGTVWFYLWLIPYINASYATFYQRLVDIHTPAESDTELQ